MDDAPLLPEHWEQVRRGLRRLYVGFFLTVLGLGVIGFVFLVLGHRTLARTGPTARVRSLARARLAMLIGALLLAGAALLAAFIDAATITLAAIVLATRLADLVLWQRTGTALAVWAGSAPLAAEWRRVPPNSAIAVALSAAALAVAGLTIGDELSLGEIVVLAVTLPVLPALPLLPLLFTSWRTYRVFSTPLVPAGAVAPPPPVGPT